MSNPNPEHQSQADNGADHREGLWDPERPARPAPTPSAPRKRALPKSWVSKTLWILIALVVVAAVLGLV